MTTTLIILQMGRAGIVTKDMLSAPNKRLFLYIGGLEAVSQLLGFIGASKLPGALQPPWWLKQLSGPKLVVLCIICRFSL